MSLKVKAIEFNKRIEQMTAYNGGEIVKKAVSGELTVEQMYEYDEMFPVWTTGKYMVDDMRRYGEKLYRCIQSHDSTGNPHWTPDITPSLWVVIQLEPKEDEILQWVAGEVVEIGDLRMYNDIMYECIQGHTTQTGWKPPNVAALWKVVT